MVLIGDFNMTIGNKDKSIDDKGTVVLCILLILN